MMALDLFFFKIALVIWDHFVVSHKFWDCLSCFFEKCHWNFDKHSQSLYIALGSTDILTILIHLMHEHRISFHFCHFLSSVFYSQPCKDFSTLWLNLLPSIFFFFFWCYQKCYFFLISLSSSQYIEAQLILYINFVSCIFTNFFISNNVLVEFLGFFIYNKSINSIIIDTFVNSNNLISSFLIR